MKKISILGSTGSIGVQSLEVIRMFPEQFKITALSAGNNTKLLLKQIKEFKPKLVSVYGETAMKELKEYDLGGTEIYFGEYGNKLVATEAETDLVISSIVGFDGLIPTLEAIRAKKQIAIANKESLVVAGELLIKEAKQNGVDILPIDSEHSAIFQALQCSDKKFLKRVIITASGGPFLHFSKERLENVTVKEALRHPTWKMGEKITVDSATLMNKGFEVIETKWLFDIPIDKIDVWIHPQSIVHSMVEYVDGSFISHLGIPDMKVPIAFALSYPERLNLNTSNITPAEFSSLTFEEVDLDKFRAFGLAIDSIKEGGTYPAVLNAANEIAVKAFLEKKIKFTDISYILSKIMDKHNRLDTSSLENIIEADSWSRNKTISMI
ncbi:MAG: 1-deoxy-D-xylulose-5-phosphate reductoisomerase [Thermodesulfobacteriota bacterium]